MNLDELRASILDALGIRLHEEDHDEPGDRHDDVILTAGAEHRDALTDWLDRTDTGRHVYMDFPETAQE